MDNSAAYAQNALVSVDTNAKHQWDQLKERIARHNRAIGDTLDWAQLVSLDGTVVRIRFDPQDAFACRLLLGPDIRQWINSILFPFSIHMELPAAAVRRPQPPAARGGA